MAELSGSDEPRPAVPSTWDSATIHIDPESDIYLEIGRPPWDGRTDTVNVDVWAEADTGALLAVYWTAGFNVTDGDPPVIRGPRGEEVARDGTRIPPGWPITSCAADPSHSTFWITSRGRAPVRLRHASGRLHPVIGPDQETFREPLQVIWVGLDERVWVSTKGAEADIETDIQVSLVRPG